MTDDLLALYRSEHATAYEQRRRGGRKWQFEHDSLRLVLLANRHSIHRIIDAPIGTGRFLELYQELRDDVVVYGFDQSDDMLAIARGRPGGPRVTLRTQDIINRSFGVRADVVVCFRFLNLLTWEDAAKTLHNLFEAAERLLVLSIRTIDDDYRGERLLENKIHLHRRSLFEQVCDEHKAQILHVEHCATGRAGDYGIVTCATHRPMRESRVNRNGRFVYTYGHSDNEGKVYEVKDIAHAEFIKTISSSALCRSFPRIIRTSGSFIDAAWIHGEPLSAASWRRALELLIKIHQFDCDVESSFDYVEDLVVPRFDKAAPLVSAGLRDHVVKIIAGRSASLVAKVSHPDIVPGNLVLSGEDVVVIDNELLCKSRHCRIDILNLLRNQARGHRAVLLASYLRGTGESLESWEEHREYLQALWCARVVGAAIITNRAAQVGAFVRAFERGENILPYRRDEVRVLLDVRDQANERQD